MPKVEVSGRVFRGMSESAVREPSVGLIAHLLDAVEDVVYAIDADGRSAFWNETLEETTGYSGAEIADMPPEQFLPPAQREATPGLGEAIEALGDGTVVLDLLTKNGETIPHEVRGRTVADPETGERYRVAIARDVRDRRARQRELERYETIVETVSDGVYTLDEDLRFSFVNEGLCELLGRERDAVLGMPVTDLFAFDDDRRAAAELRRRVTEGDVDVGTIAGTGRRPDGSIFEAEARYHLNPAPVDGEYRGSVGVVRDVTARNRKERRLERQRDELETLERINRILLETTRDLVQTADREVVERTICGGLTDADPYEFAWTIERAVDGDRVRPRTAPEGVGALDGLAAVVDAEEGLAARARRTAEVQVRTAGDPGWERWARVAEEYGFGAVAAVPLHHEGTVYGTLLIHSARETAFGERERTGFAVLGRTVGFVINALRTHELLFSDTVDELELRVADTDAALVELATALDCELRLDGCVAAGQEWLAYVDVDGAPVADVVAAATERPGVERARAISASDGSERIELVYADPSLFHTVDHAGAAVTSAVAGPTDARLVVETPVDADVRDVVEPIRRDFPAVALLARREVDRAAATADGLNGGLAGLTDRQRQVLEVAYRAGYFDWPRDSTAAEVAESLDIASATLHGHLRKAEAGVLEALFDRG